MPALPLGSISTIADRSEPQRQAFNQAFAEHRLDGRRDQDQYRAMLSASGGQAGIAGYARSRGQTVGAKAVHETKSTIFQENLAKGGLAPRFPSENAAGDDFSAAQRRVGRPGLSKLTRLA